MADKYKTSEQIKQELDKLISDNIGIYDKSLQYYANRSRLEQALKTVTFREYLIASLNQQERLNVILERDNIELADRREAVRLHRDVAKSVKQIIHEYL